MNWFLNKLPKKSNPQEQYKEFFSEMNSYIKHYVCRQDKPFMTLSFPNIMFSAARPAIRKSSLASTWSLLELTMSECPSGNSLVYRNKTQTINKPNTCKTKTIRNLH